MKNLATLLLILITSFALKGQGIFGTGIGGVTTNQFAQSHGWVVYADTTYTVSSAFALATGDGQTALPNDAGTLIDSYLPVGLGALYDKDSLELNGTLGSSYQMRLRFKAKPTGAAASPRIKFSLDIGGAIGEILARDIILTKGNGVEHDVLISFNYYALSTFVANGADIYVQVFDEDVEIYDLEYLISILHNVD
jgi:hypothetical protein